MRQETSISRGVDPLYPPYLSCPASSNLNALVLQTILF